MKPASENPPMPQDEPAATAFRIPIEPSLQALLVRLDALSRRPTFALQREMALGVALRPYTQYAQRVLFAPLPEEFNLALLYLYADFFPEDGQLSLIEQVRDTIDVHVPEEERAWLDPLRHSYMDLLEIRSVEASDGGRLTLRSLGDGLDFSVEAGAFGLAAQAGQALLTRLIRLPARTVLAGTALVLSSSHAQALFKAADEWRRQMETESGSFALGEWQEFAKRYGYILLWQFAQARLRNLVKADEGIRYCRADGQPFLYALAQYDHHEFRFVSDGLSRMEGVDAEAGADPSERTWVQRGRAPEGPSAKPQGDIVARLTLTPSQLIVECDSPERLDNLKHRLASAFGFSLHFQAEAATAPAHALSVSEADLATENVPSLSVAVPPDEERRLLVAFLDTLYLEWADRPSPVLGGRTPRHAMASPDHKTQVAELIAQLERSDLALRRTGRPGYDYDKLRSHVGLPEVRA